MLYEVIGYKPISYTRKSDQKHIEGVEVYLAADPEDDRVVGREAMAVYLSREKAHYRDPEIGDIVRLSYNRFGRVEDLIPMD